MKRRKKRVAEKPEEPRPHGLGPQVLRETFSPNTRPENREKLRAVLRANAMATRTIDRVLSELAQGWLSSLLDGDEKKLVTTLQIEEIKRRGLNGE
jgi:hypothetical protein